MRRLFLFILIFITTGAAMASNADSALVEHISLEKLTQQEWLQCYVDLRGYEPCMVDPAEVGRYGVHAYHCCVDGLLRYNRLSEDMATLNLVTASVNKLYDMVTEFRLNDF